MDYQVVLSPSARADLHAIVRYISFDAPDRALEFGRFLISRTRFLAGAPELGRIVPEFEDEFIREIIVRSYRVVYRLDHTNHSIEVIRFWHAARGTPEINL
jgi:plasmid stabilization system protein ParE